MKVVIEPAILVSTVKKLDEQLRSVKSTRYHVDIMDGKFVPRTTISGRGLAKAKTSAFIEAHLMIRDPIKHLKEFAKCADLVVPHIEVLRNPAKFIADAHHLGLQVGLAVNPETPITSILHFVPDLDYVLIMTVHPGKQGQYFHAEALKKVKYLRTRYPSLSIGVDGGVNLESVALAAHAGASVLIAGSAIYWSEHPQDAMRALQKKVSI